MSEAESLSQIITIDGQKYHENTTDIFSEGLNSVVSMFGGRDDYFVEHKAYDKADETFIHEAFDQAATGLIGFGIGKGISVALANNGAKLGNLAFAETFGIQSYSKLTALIKGTGLEAHHLIEQRFANTLGVTARSMESIAVTKAEHQAFTNALRAQIGYEGSKATITTLRASKEQIYQAARIVYKDSPHILKTLGL